MCFFDRCCEYFRLGLKSGVAGINLRGLTMYVVLLVDGCFSSSCILVASDNTGTMCFASYMWIPVLGPNMRPSVPFCLFATSIHCMYLFDRWLLLGGWRGSANTYWPSSTLVFRVGTWKGRSLPMFKSRILLAEFMFWKFLSPGRSFDWSLFRKCTGSGIGRFTAIVFRCCESRSRNGIANRERVEWVMHICSDISLWNHRIQIICIRPSAWFNLF